MTNLSLDTSDLPLGYEPSTPLPISKPAPFTMDLLDLETTKASYTPSSLSTYDSISVKAEEDSCRHTTVGEESSMSKGFEELAAAELNNSRKLTLGDIVSKRAYIRRSKDVNKIFEKSVRQRKRTANVRDNDPEEIIVKKEKLEQIVKDDKQFFPEIVLKDGKVVIEEHAPLQTNQLKQELEIVQAVHMKMTTSASFKQAARSDKWTERETAKFYRALEIFGTEFSMIAQLFKSRNRSQIKNKFLREEKMSPEKINSALKGSGSISFCILLQKFKNLNQTQNKCVSSQIIDKESNDNYNLDIIDMNIMEDLSDVFLPQKNLLNI